VVNFFFGGLFAVNHSLLSVWRIVCDDLFVVLNYVFCGELFVVVVKNLQ
jgi:hypothetical protein